jgi:hypothetical protein
MWQPPYPMTPEAPRSVRPIVPLPPQFVTAPDESAYTSQAGTWQRVLLAPGVELHYLATGDARFHETVARLIEAARHMLEATPEKAGEES